MTDRTIPLPVIPVTAEALKDTYSESKLRGLFTAAGIELPSGSKMTKVELCMSCLAWANKHLPDPVKTLGGIIGDLMDRTADGDDQLMNHQKQIAAALSNNQYKYARGGVITPTGMRSVMVRVSSMASASQQTSPPTPRSNQGGAASGVARSAKARLAPAQSPSTEKPPMTSAPRPSLFIGSTVEALDIARAVHAELDHDLEVTLWNHGLFPAGVMTWSQLLRKSQDFDFALFIFSGDDQVDPPVA